MTISVSEAGRRGGLSCRDKRGRRFFVEIGKAGQAAMRVKYPRMARKWGKLGGRPIKLNLADVGGGKSTQTEEDADPPRLGMPPPQNI